MTPADALVVLWLTALLALLALAASPRSVAALLSDDADD